MACQCLYSILPAHPCPKSLFQSIFLLTQFAFWKFFILTPHFSDGRTMALVLQAEDSEGTVITVHLPLPWSNVQLTLPKKKTLHHSSSTSM